MNIDARSTLHDINNKLSCIMGYMELFMTCDDLSFIKDRSSKCLKCIEEINALITELNEIYII